MNILETLTSIVGLGDRVRVVEGSVTSAPLVDRSVDAVVSQEAFLHIPDYPAAVAEAYRVLRPGGRAVISTLTAPAPLSAEDQELLRRGLGFQALPSKQGWADTFRGAGFDPVQTEDLTDRWATILKERLAMYTALREETSKRGNPTGDNWFHEAYPRFVELIASGGLGGALITATKPR